MKKAMIWGLILTVILCTGCTLDMLGYYDYGEMPSSMEREADKETADEEPQMKLEPGAEQISVNEVIQENQEEAIEAAGQKVETQSNQQERKNVIREEEKVENSISEPEDGNRKTPEEIEKMKEEAKQKVLDMKNRMNEDDEDAEAHVDAVVEWFGDIKNDTLIISPIDMKTGELCETKDLSRKKFICRLYYNGRDIVEDPFVYVVFDGENQESFTITKDCSWRKNGQIWELDVCSVDYKNKKIEPLLYQ